MSINSTYNLHFLKAGIMNGGNTSATFRLLISQILNDTTAYIVTNVMSKL